jgi:hypothetical protein
MKNKFGSSIKNEKREILSPHIFATHLFVSVPCPVRVGLRRLMSPNFALILSTPGCDDPTMILPSTIRPTLAHIFAIHLFASFRSPIRVGPLPLIPRFSPFFKAIQTFSNINL